jgi:outer membrane protein
MRKIVFAALAGLACAGAWAQQTTTIAVGGAFIDPKSSSTDVTGAYTPSGLSLHVHKQNTPYFSITRSFTENLSVELALGVPPTHDVDVQVNNATLPPSIQAASGTVVAKVRQVGPTVFGKYTFGSRSQVLRPYVGLGVNMTSFDKADSTSGGDAFNGGATAITLSKAHGWAACAGLDYKLGGPWTAHLGLATTHLKTTMKSNTLGITRTADITLKPMITTVAIGYTF